MLVCVNFQRRYSKTFRRGFVKAHQGNTIRDIQKDSVFFLRTLDMVFFVFRNLQSWIFSKDFFQWPSFLKGFSFKPFPRTVKRNILRFFQERSGVIFKGFLYKIFFMVLQLWTFYIFFFNFFRGQLLDFSVFFLQGPSDVYFLRIF